MSYREVHILGPTKFLCLYTQYSTDTLCCNIWHIATNCDAHCRRSFHIVTSLQKPSLRHHSVGSCRRRLGSHGLKKVSPGQADILLSSPVYSDTSAVITRPSLSTQTRPGETPTSSPASEPNLFQSDPYCSLLQFSRLTTLELSTSVILRFILLMYWDTTG